MNLNQATQNKRNNGANRDKNGKFVKKQLPPQAAENGLYGAVQVVTSNRLKRSYVNNGVKVDFFIPDETFTELTVIGLRLGVTWDECLRGIIDQHLASSDTTTGLKLFVPALQ